MEGCFQTRMGVIVPRLSVKRTKDALEAQGRLDKNSKIKRFAAHQCEIIDDKLGDGQEDLFFIPVLANGQRKFESVADFVELTGLQDHIGPVCLASMLHPIDVHSMNSQLNPLASTIARWSHQYLGIDIGSCSQLLLRYRWTYMVYQPLLLLPSSTFSHLLSAFAIASSHSELFSLYRLLCDSLNVSHVALNAPIPEEVLPRSQYHSFSPGERQSQSSHKMCKNEPNILRSPTGLTPLYGDFGPDLIPEHAPTAGDFAAAFWCSAQQNGIFQTWAPRYTMFSRGNISEKARLLVMESLTEKRLQVGLQQTSAVDLYAGIGYFAFSYAKTGVGKILCWEINPWSVEGFMRGALKNRWTVQSVSEDVSSDASVAKDSRFLIFRENNEHAASRISKIRGNIPPVRHVNCGLLPSSRGSWGVAVQIIDPVQGGWIHTHENVAKKDIEMRKYEVAEIFKDLMEKHRDQLLGHPWAVECEHVEQVKSYAPGVIHCVFDIAIQPDISA